MSWQQLRPFFSLTLTKLILIKKDVLADCKLFSRFFLFSNWLIFDFLLFLHFLFSFFGLLFLFLLLTLLFRSFLLSPQFFQQGLELFLFLLFFAFLLFLLTTFYLFDRLLRGRLSDRSSLFFLFFIFTVRWLLVAESKRIFNCIQMELFLFQLLSLESSLDGLEMCEITSSKFLLSIERNNIRLSFFIILLSLLDFLSLSSLLLLTDNLGFYLLSLLLLWLRLVFIAGYVVPSVGGFSNRNDTLGFGVSWVGLGLCLWHSFGWAWILI